MRNVLIQSEFQSIPRKGMNDLKHIKILYFIFTGCGHWIEKPVEQDQFSLYQRDPKISTLPTYAAQPPNLFVCHVGILRFHNIFLSISIKEPDGCALQNNTMFSLHPNLCHFSRIFEEKLSQVWIFSHSKLVCYNIVITESVFKKEFENTFKVLFLST